MWRLGATSNGGVMRHIGSQTIHTLLFLCLLPVGSATAQQADTVDVDEVGRKLANPLSDVWNLVFQNNTTGNQGDLVAGTTVSNVLNFQPVLPIPIGKLNLTTRPVIPFSTQPVLDASDPSGTSGSESGLGDIVLLSLIGPASTGFVWGVGPSVVLPTATNDALGLGEWQLGPAALLLWTTPEIILGTLAQQWWSVGVDPGGSNTSILNLQYFIFKPLPGGWMIGTSPSVIINWKASSGQKVTFPIGLGAFKMLSFGRQLTQWSLEGQYSVISPDDYGSKWNIRALVKIVVKNPFVGS